MKKIFLSLFFVVLATTGLYAQQISVVSSGGATSLYRTLEEAIKGASDGSVIYLPGGSFSIADSVKITKKLTIIGIGHFAKSGNVDGFTVINGNLWFRNGSSSSAVIGCYLTGNINIGDDGAAVNDLLIRCCNVNQIIGMNNTCKGTIVNLNYLRVGASFNKGPAEITHNIIQGMASITGGIISNNIVCVSGRYPLNDIKNSIITNNIFFNKSSDPTIYNSSDDSIYGNMVFKSFPEDFDVIDLSELNPNDVFENYNGGVVSPVSDFHFKEAYKQYENQVGVYAGGVDFDKQLAPVPYIVAKRVDTETDSSGKLNVRIRVKAGQ